MAAVTLSDVRKAYGDVVAVDGVTLEVDRGTVHALAGPNGSGKTTVLRMIADLARPSGGSVAVATDAVNYAFQQPSVYPDLTVRENLATFRGVQGASADWQAHLVETLALGEMLDRPARQLSDGFGKKLDLALALLGEPTLLLLDEPLADLDDVTQRALVDLLGEYATDERTLVLSTHNLRRFDDLVDRLTVLDGGRVALDEPASALEDPPHRTYERLLDGPVGPE